MKHVEIRSSV